MESRNPIIWHSKSADSCFQFFFDGSVFCYNFFMLPIKIAPYMKHYTPFFDIR